MNGIARAAPAFDYRDVPAEAREWLRGRAEHVNALAYRTVCDYVRIGQALAEARARLGRSRTFKRWVAAELAFGRQWAYRLMAIARAFGEYVRPDSAEVIDTRALTLLVNAPPGARAFALEQAAEGNRVTVEEARQIIDAHRPVADPDKAAVKEYEAAAAAVLGGAPAVSLDHEAHRAARAWALLEKLAGLGAGVYVTRVSDAEDDADPAPFHVTAMFPAGRREAQRQSLIDAVAAVLDEEPTRQCPTCKRHKKYGEFGQDRSRPNGKSTYCRKCAGKRTARLKKLRRAARREAQQKATA